MAFANSKTLSSPLSRQQNWQRKLANLGLFFLTFLVVAISVVASVPALRDRVRLVFRHPFREVLGKVRGDVTGKGKLVSVIKVKTESGLRLEIFESIGESSNERPWTQIELDERNDGYVSMQGQPTNLALVDVDQDGTLEIVAPTYDENLIPRLHVFKYDPDANIWVKLGPDSTHSER